MQRDFELVRLILKTVETIPAGKKWDKPQCDGYTDEVVQEHVVLLIENNFIEGSIHKPVSGAKSGVATALTWGGHDFLNAAKDDTIWAKAKETVLAPTASMTFGILLEWLKMEVKAKFGMPS